MNVSDPYRLRLLGPFVLVSPDNQRIEISSKKGMALIALLAMAPEGERSRVWLQTKLWGSRESRQAQASLRRELSNLKNAMGLHHYALLRVGQSRVGLDIDRINVDARGIEAHLKASSGSVMLAFGEFLEGIDLPGEEEFEDWLRIQRDLIGELAEREKRAALKLRVDDKQLSFATLLGDQPETDRQDIAQWTEKTALPLPNRPSIAVLPFTNLSADNSHGSFAEGIVEELSFSLARYSTLFVVSSSSTLAYPDPTRDMAIVCRDLGVRYLLKGSVRLSSTRVRVTVILIDGIANEQVWSDRFEESLDDIFDLQDRVAHAVAILIDSNIEKAEMKRAVSRPITSPDAYQLYYRANATLRLGDRDSIYSAIALSEQVLTLEPENSWAAALGGFCYSTVFRSNWSDDPLATREAAVALLERSLRFGNEDPVVMGFGAGTLVQTLGDLKVADLLVERSLAIIPGYSSSLFWGGWVDVAAGDSARALERFQMSLRLNPLSTVRPFTQTGLGIALIGMGRFEEASIVLREATSLLPNYSSAIAALAVALMNIGSVHEAHAMAQRLPILGGIEGALAFIQNAEFRQSLADDLARAIAAENAISAS